MDSKFLVHKIMESKFGYKSSKTTHSWLRTATGKCHVSDCTEQQCQKAIRRLKQVRIVRASTWKRLENDKRMSS